MTTVNKPINITRPQIIETAQRREYVLEQRKGGSTYREIAKATINKYGASALPKNYDERYAHDDVMAELKRLHESNKETAQDILDLELIRLDRMQTAIWGDVLHGDEKAIDRVLRIMQRRADLLGLDAPKNVDIKSGGEKLNVMVYIPDNGRDGSS